MVRPPPKPLFLKRFQFVVEGCIFSVRFRVTAINMNPEFTIAPVFKTGVDGNRPAPAMFAWNTGGITPEVFL